MERTPLPPIAQAAADASAVREQQHATALGLVLTGGDPQPVPTRGTVPPFDVSLAAGECAAYIATAWGRQQVEWVAVHDAANDGVELAVDEADSALSAHVQWCVDRPSTLRFRARVQPRDSGDPEAEGFFQGRLYRGPGVAFGGLEGIRRGTPTLAGGRWPRAETLLATATARAGGVAPSGPDIGIPTDAAVLVPEDATTYGALHRSAQGTTTDNVSPRVALLPPGVPPAWRPSGAMSVASLRALVTPLPDPGPQFPFLSHGGARRVLAVIDTARLGVRCAQLRFVRLHLGREARVTRTHPDGRTSVVLTGARNEAHDPACATAGLAMYSVDDADQESYVLRIY
ncbi:MAG: hypothetical protein IT379_18240 [Deltaproteobacteria bacterium]|nr:hypothetical protein [Deltaproteobacteria bacterium]